MERVTTVSQSSSRADAGRAEGEGFEQQAGEVGAAADLGAGLVDAAVAAEQGKGLGEGVVRAQVGVEQLEQPGVGGIGRPAGQQGRQRRDALAQVGARRLAGLRRW